MREDDFLLPREAKLAETVAELQGTLNEVRAKLTKAEAVIVAIDDALQRDMVLDNASYDPDATLHQVDTILVNYFDGEENG